MPPDGASTLAPPAVPAISAHLFAAANAAGALPPTVLAFWAFCAFWAFWAFFALGTVDSEDSLISVPVSEFFLILIAPTARFRRSLPLMRILANAVPPSATNNA